MNTISRLFTCAIFYTARWPWTAKNLSRSTKNGEGELIFRGRAIVWVLLIPIVTLIDPTEDQFSSLFAAILLESDLLLVSRLTSLILCLVARKTFHVSYVLRSHLKWIKWIRTHSARLAHSCRVNYCDSIHSFQLIIASLKSCWSCKL